MTDQQHPITPPPELIQKWWEGDNGALDEFDEVIKQAARWGADRELEACCAWVQGYAECGDSLRAARRPNPKSLAEEALEALNVEDDARPVRSWEEGERFDTIRRALERLQELEANS